MTAALANSQVEFPPHSDREAGSAREARRIRHVLRATAARLLPRERVARCGRKLLRASVDITLSEGRAHVAGVETCGSVWLCPECAGKIAEGRRRDVARALDGHKAAGGVVYMGLFTVPHQRFQFVAHLRDTMSLAWRRLVSGAPWKRAKAAYGVSGFVKTMEVTHGQKAGWHPHFHVLFFTENLDPEREEAFRVWLFERWAKIVEKLGLGECSPAAFGLQRNEGDTEAAGQYVTKWGCDAELTKWHLKRGRGGSRSPWDLLRLASEGDGEAAMRFREYAAAFKGKRQLTWSVGLRDLYLSDAELMDEELAASAPGTVIGTLRKVVWVRVQRAGAVPDILDAAENGGWPAVLAVLVAKGLALGGEPIRIGGSGTTAPPWEWGN